MKLTDVFKGTRSLLMFYNGTRSRLRTKQSINSKLHLMPRKSEFLLWKIPGALIQFVERNWSYAMETRDVNTHLCGNQIFFFYNVTRSLLMFYNVTRSLLMFYNVTRSLLMFYNVTRSLLMFYNVTRREPWYNLSSETEVMLWKPEMWIHISVETKYFS
jgi:hypothetical protein